MSQTFSSDGAAPGRNRLSPIWGNWANPPCWAPGLVLLDCAEVAHTRAKIMWTQTHWEPEGGGGGDISTPLTASAAGSLFLRQVRTSRFRGLDLPKATALHVKATATRPCSSPRSPSSNLQLPSSCSCAPQVRQGHPMPCPGLPDSDSLAPSSSYSAWKKETHRKPERK